MLDKFGRPWTKPLRVRDLLFTGICSGSCFLGTGYLTSIFPPVVPYRHADIYSKCTGVSTELKEWTVLPLSLASYGFHSALNYTLHPHGESMMACTHALLMSVKRFVMSFRAGGIPLMCLLALCLFGD